MVSRSSSCSAAKRRNIFSVSAGSSTSTAGLPRQGAQRVEDHRDIDALLQQRTRGGRQPAQRGDRHRQQRQRHADHGALHGDAPRPAGDVHRIGETVQTIGGQHDVGGLRGRRRAARAHRDTDRRRRQRGSVVDSVADHDRHRAIPFGAHRGDLVGRALLGVDLVEPEHGRDLAGRLGAVAGQHDQPVQPGGAQPPDGAGCVAAQRVPQQYRTGWLAVDAHPMTRISRCATLLNL